MRVPQEDPGERARGGWVLAGARAPEARGRERDNVEGERRERAAHPEWYRFLDPEAPNHALKRVETELYLRRLVPRLAALGGAAGAPARILDVGGGTGRLALPLAALGHSVTVVEPGLAALADAAAAIAAHGAGSPVAAPIALMHGGAYDLSTLADGSFDAALAVEVLCYLEQPERALAEIERVVRPGGVVALSVEAWPGGLLAARDVPSGEIERALATRVLHRPGDLFVRYYGASELETLERAAGLDDVTVAGHHFVLEGPLGAALDGLDISDPAAVATILDLEERLSADVSCGALARAVLAIGVRR